MRRIMTLSAVIVLAGPVFWECEIARAGELGACCLVTGDCAQRRAGYEQPVQDGHEDCPLHRELVLAAGQQLFDDVLDPPLAPQPFEYQGRPDLDRFDRRKGPAFVGIHHRDVLGESAARREEGVDVVFFLKLIDPAESGNDPSANASVEAFILDSLEILVATGLFGSDEHTWAPISITRTWAAHGLSSTKLPFLCGYWHYIPAACAQNLL